MTEAPTFTSGSSIDFTAGTPGSSTVATSGYPSPTTLTETGALPSWLSFSTQHDGTATLAGTPPLGTKESTSFSVTSSNGTAQDATEVITVTVTTPVVGIAFVDPSGGTATCDVAAPAQVTCALVTIGSGGSFSAKVELVNAAGQPVSEANGAAILVTATLVKLTTASLTPPSSTITEGQSATKTAFVLTEDGPTSSGMVVLTVTVGGRTYTIAATDGAVRTTTNDRPHHKGRGHTGGHGAPRRPPAG